MPTQPPEPPHRNDNGGALLSLEEQRGAPVVRSRGALR
jgi:hypothetical protein